MVKLMILDTTLCLYSEYHLLLPHVLYKFTVSYELYNNMILWTGACC